MQNEMELKTKDEMEYMFEMYLNKFFIELATRQQELGQEFTKILNDNMWDLYVE